MDEKIAEIFSSPKSYKKIRISFSKVTIKFKCKRCAVFCCKLGGPTVTKQDIERIIKAGYQTIDFLVQYKAYKFRKKCNNEVQFKQNGDGSCIFLEYEKRNNIHKCAIYDLRPEVCRMYPFEVEYTSSRKMELSFIPCCNGLNTSDGKPVDKDFIIRNFIEVCARNCE